MSETKEQLLTKLGFRFGANGPHSARTMMLDDLRMLFSYVPANALRADYKQAVFIENILGKPTKKTRELALRHLTTLYGLDTQLPLAWPTPNPKHASCSKPSSRRSWTLAMSRWSTPLPKHCLTVAISP